jgi:hypothetical protein
MSPALQSRPAPNAPPRRPLDALEDVECLAPDATGALVYGARARPAGTVLVEGGRVCWAVAEGMTRRLTDLVRQEADAPIESRRIEEVYSLCRSRHRPLGETLVAHGIVSPEGLRRALRRHTTEALLAIAATGEGRREWVEHRRRRYDAQFTFSIVELVVCAGEMFHAELVGAARAELDAIVPREAGGLSFARTSGHAGIFPIVDLRAAHLGLRELGALGRWAAGALDIAGALDAPRPTVTLGAEGGDSVVAWANDAVIHVALCGERSSRAWVEVKVERARNERTRARSD